MASAVHTCFASLLIIFVLIKCRMHCFYQLTPVNSMKSVHSIANGSAELVTEMYLPLLM